MGIDRQQPLQPLQGIEQREAGGVEGQHGERVVPPALLSYIMARKAMQKAFDGREDRCEKCLLPRIETRQKDAGAPCRNRGEAEYEDDLEPTGEGHRILPQ